MVIMVVKFKSDLSEQKVEELAKKHMHEFASLDRLAQKYYIKDPQTGEYGGVYFWDSMEAVQQFQQSGLGPKVLGEFQLQGQPRVEVLQVSWTLRPEEHLRAAV